MAEHDSTMRPDPTTLRVLAVVFPEARLATPQEVARDLYAVLHRFDELGPQAIVVLVPPARPKCVAIPDRMGRSTHPIEGQAGRD